MYCSPLLTAVVFYSPVSVIVFVYVLVTLSRVLVAAFWFVDDQHQLLPPLPRHASRQTAQSRWRHPHTPLDVHQILPGDVIAHVTALQSQGQVCNGLCLFGFQALPYVALLIVMLFFIYAVIGMQVIQLLQPLSRCPITCTGNETTKCRWLLLQAKWKCYCFRGIRFWCFENTVL